MTERKQAAEVTVQVVDPATVGERSAAPAGQGEKAGKTIPVRFTHEQWIQAKIFAASEGMSMQELFIAGFNRLRVDKGLPPLSGT